MFLHFWLWAAILLYHSFVHCKLLKSHSLNILQYRRLLMYKKPHGSYLQLTEPYEFCQMTLDSNHTNK